ncbi:MAG: hypothetical protein CM1200mP2_35120 [Planctomycetaceae bacterium]|nr:MAG: hypothetical protein CM1200mP2_35120 [Planctomycetaceae bacterium]
MLLVGDLQRALNRLNSSPPDCLVMMGGAIGSEIVTGFKESARRTDGRPIAQIAVLSKDQAAGEKAPRGSRLGDRPRDGPPDRPRGSEARDPVGVGGVLREVRVNQVDDRPEIRFGILGTARIAEKVGPAIQAANGARLDVVASRDGDRAREWANAHQGATKCRGLSSCDRRSRNRRGLHSAAQLDAPCVDAGRGRSGKTCAL